jgi:hypothetical protein
MATFAQMLTRFKQFDPIEATGDAMLENKEQIIGINQHMLYEEGKNVEGEKLAPYRSMDYAQYKYDRRGRYITDLYDTGATYSKMNLRVDGNEYEINSSDEKAYGLVAKYGKIFGLNELGKKETWVIIHPDFVANFKRKVNL